MKAILFWASSALLYSSTVVAQGLRQATGGPEGTPVPWYPEPEPEVSDCKANLITTLCDYKEPEEGTAVASSGKAYCWEHCNNNPPCNFVIFVQGNPYTGSGTCWLYPGEDFDESAGKGGCDYISVFGKPDCGDPTPTAGACEATASPSALASVCDYPAPQEPCFNNCYASSGAVNCLSLCAEADSCTYAVFNPGDESHSPCSPGNCWVFESGSFDESKAKTCSDKPEQFVYKNPCPKPPKPSTTSSALSATSTPGGDGSSPSSGDEISSSRGDSSSTSPTGSSSGARAEEASEGGSPGNDDTNGSLPISISVSGLFAASLAAMIWQGFR